jgi:hypothetical protein
MFGEDFHELTSDGTETERFSAMCEGCGVISVDRDGRCLVHTDQQHEDAILRGKDPS